MNKQEILKKVGNILNELNDQYEYLSKNPDHLSEIELELFSANASFLSDHLSILVKMNGKSSEPLVAQKEEERPAEIEPPMIAEEKIEPVKDWKFDLDEEPAMNFEFEEKNTDQLYDRPLTDDEQKIIDEKTTLKSPDPEPEDEYIDFEEEHTTIFEEVHAEIQDEENVKEVFIAERTFAIPTESPAEEIAAPTMNEILSRNVTQETVSSQFNSMQKKDLKSMISLNDKLLFVRDLFNGYSLAYSEAIELVNRFDNFESADNFLKQNYAGKNSWGEKQDVADKFYEILNRRFAK